MGNKKASPQEGWFLLTAGGKPLDFTHVHCIDTLTAFLRVELNPVVLLNLRAVQTGNVDEEVLFGSVVGNKAIALGLIIEFYDSRFHGKEDISTVGRV
jgi:hypothetical protein